MKRLRETEKSSKKCCIREREAMAVSQEKFVSRDGGQ